MGRRVLHRMKWPLVTAVTVFIFNLPLIFYAFPLSEGWWETFGYLINQGLRPFRDFSLPVSPAFAYWNAALLRLVGTNFLVLRLIGVVEVSGTAAICFLLARRLSRDNAVAFAATLLASVLFFSGSPYIAKDYHSMVDLLVAADLLVLMSYLDPSYAGRPPFRRFVIVWMLATISALLVFVKINIGVFLAASVGFAILVDSHRRKSLKTELGAYFSIFMLSIAAGLLLGSLASDMSITQLVATIVRGDSSKGSITTVLMRFAMDPNNRRMLNAAMFLPIVFTIVLYLLPKTASVLFRLAPAQALSLRWRLLLVLGVVAVPILMIVILYNAGRLGSTNPAILTVLSIVSLSVLIFASSREWWRYVRHRRFRPFGLLTLSFITLAYCNTQTASFDNNGLFFVNLYSFALIGRVLSVAIKRGRYVGDRVAQALFILVAVSLVPGVWYWKYLAPYEWWGLTVGPIGASKFNLGASAGGAPQLKGIYADSQTFQSYQAILNLIRMQPRSDRSNVYLFPDIPIFYLLTNKIPPTKNVVQWFDVVTSSQLQQDVNYVDSRKAALIVSLTPPSFAFLGNGELVGHMLVQRTIVKAFPRLVGTGFYTVCYASALKSPNAGAFVSIKAEYVGKRPLSIQSLMQATHATAVNYGYGPMEAGLAQLDSVSEVRAGGRVTLTMPDDLPALVKLGFVPLDSPDTPILLALCKTGASAASR